MWYTEKVRSTLQVSAAAEEAKQEKKLNGERESAALL